MTRPAFDDYAASSPSPEQLASATIAREGVLDAVLRAAIDSGTFTPRERDTLRCLLRGMDNKQIGDALGCGHKTVETHVTHLLSKARVRSRLELVSACWIRWATSLAPATWPSESTTGVSRTASGVRRIGG